MRSDFTIYRSQKNHASVLKRIIFNTCSLAIVVVSLNYPIAKAQTQQLELPANDISAPQITIEQNEQKESVIANGSYSISASVIDNSGVKSVSLFFRTAGTKKYINLPMERVGMSDLYIAHIPSRRLQVPGIEYYLQAEDIAGNTVLRGYSFEPLTINVIGKDKDGLTLPVLGTEKQESKENGAKKWLWIGLGALAVGALAGGGGGGSGGGTDTGSVDIAAPLP